MNRVILLLLAVSWISLAATPMGHQPEMDQMGAGYKAKTVCSGVFVSRRSPKQVLEQDVGELSYPTQVDWSHGKVEAQWAGGSVIAVYRGPRYGCTLIPRGEASFGSGRPDLPAAETETGSSFPELPGAHDVQSKLNRVLEEAFREEHPEKPKNTRAIVVVRRGKIIGERYAEAKGITKNTRLIGWSMTKSVTNALVGILVEHGFLSLYAPHQIRGWADDDPRNGITLDDLLRMASGLDFKEVYQSDQFSDVARMLFLAPSMPEYVQTVPLKFRPGSHWHYSSGDTMLISKLVRQSFDGKESAYEAFPWDNLFDPIGMKSAVWERDASGTFVGAVYLHATARDWARFGLLYLNRGVMNGRRILPEWWIDYSRSPSPLAEQYGAQFYRVTEAQAARYGLPSDIYLAAGFKGQAVFIIPSLGLVIVRLGWTEEGNWDPFVFLQQVIRASA